MLRRWRRFGRTEQEALALGVRLTRIRWDVVLLLTLTAAWGLAMLYSAGGGSWEPWAWRHGARFGIALAILFMVALVDIKFWFRVAYPGYLAAIGLLVSVEYLGVGTGSQRWIDLGPILLQPSELMKIALVLALARYFHGLSHEDVGRIIYLIVPTAMVLLPVALVLRQPDLGTAGMLLMGAGALFFLAGVRWWKFAAVFAAALAALPLAWQFLKDYQKERVFTFFNPDRDPLGGGHHITQSKIALGSGGMFGKGYLQGTQSHLEFLPEKQTDFIFTMVGEEFGLVGTLSLIAIYLALLAYGYVISLSCRHQFGRLVALGVTTTFFLYVFINMAMVMGLIPVVGVPLPLVSYGGTAMLTVMVGFGLLLGVYIHRDRVLGAKVAGDP